MHVYTCVCMSTCMCTCGSHRSNWNVIPPQLSTSFFKDRISYCYWELTDSTMVAGQRVTRILPSVSTAVDYKYVLP